MNKILVATIAAVAMSGAASAADMSMPMKARPAPPPVYSWTGCYIDGGGGAGMWNQSHTTIANTTGAPLTGEQTSGGRGWYGEVGGGCDYQFSLGTMGNFVVGVLGGYDFMDLKGAYSDSLFVTATGYEKESGSGFAGGRLGYLVTPNLLTYTSGGWTNARFNGFTATIPGVGPSYSLASHTYNGYFLGGGLEYSLAGWFNLPQGIFLRSDYRWSTYRQANLPYLTVAGTPFPGGTGDSAHMNKYVQQIGTELIWRFNYH
jgi:outer membrane immunogenic protein